MVVADPAAMSPAKQPIVGEGQVPGGGEVEAEDADGGLDPAL
ncbi:MAG: hypothetical protein RJA36_1444 [Pseudomonadota bacterium]|jgi:hypothetical protein